MERHIKYGESVKEGAYKNMFDAICKILRKEGWPGLYKGIFPSVLKAAPAGAVTFVAYEWTSEWLESTWT